MARPKGAPNKRSSAARLQLAKLNVDPLARTAECAKLLYDNDEYDKAGALYAKLIDYLHPKLMAVKHDVDLDGMKVVEIKMLGVGGDSST